MLLLNSDKKVMITSQQGSLIGCRRIHYSVFVFYLLYNTCPNYLLPSITLKNPPHFIAASRVLMSFF